MRIAQTSRLHFQVPNVEGRLPSPPPVVAYTNAAASATPMKIGISCSNPSTCTLATPPPLPTAISRSCTTTSHWKAYSSIVSTVPETLATAEQLAVPTRMTAAESAGRLDQTLFKSLPPDSIYLCICIISIFTTYSIKAIEAGDTSVCDASEAWISKSRLRQQRCQQEACSSHQNFPLCTAFHMQQGRNRPTGSFACLIWFGGSTAPYAAAHYTTHPGVWLCYEHLYKDSQALTATKHLIPSWLHI